MTIRPKNQHAIRGWHSTKDRSISEIAKDAYNSFEEFVFTGDEEHLTNANELYLRLCTKLQSILLYPAHKLDTSADEVDRYMFELILGATAIARRIAMLKRGEQDETVNLDELAIGLENAVKANDQEKSRFCSYDLAGNKEGLVYVLRVINDVRIQRS